MVQLLFQVNGTRKLLDFMLDNLAVSSSHPPSRPWIQLSPLDRANPTALFTVMCYNVLCDRLTDSGLHYYLTSCVQIRHPGSVRILSAVGPQLGVQEER